MKCPSQIIYSLSLYEVINMFTVIKTDVRDRKVELLSLLKCCNSICWSCIFSISNCFYLTFMIEFTLFFLTLDKKHSMPKVNTLSQPVINGLFCGRQQLKKGFVLPCDDVQPQSQHRGLSEPALVRLWCEKLLLHYTTTGHDVSEGLELKCIVLREGIHVFLQKGSEMSRWPGFPFAGPSSIHTAAGSWKRAIKMICALLLLTVCVCVGEGGAGCHKTCECLFRLWKRGVMWTNVEMDAKW